MLQATAVLGIALIAFGEEIGHGPSMCEKDLSGPHDVCGSNHIVLAVNARCRNGMQID